MCVSYLTALAWTLVAVYNALKSRLYISAELVMVGLLKPWHLLSSQVPYYIWRVVNRKHFLSNVRMNSPMLFIARHAVNTYGLRRLVECKEPSLPFLVYSLNCTSWSKWNTIIKLAPVSTLQLHWNQDGLTYHGRTAVSRITAWQSLIKTPVQFLGAMRFHIPLNQFAYIFDSA